jgi:raffinose/stachyose/melibiose transport system substrate-binding protein
VSGTKSAAMVGPSRRWGVALAIACLALLASACGSPDSAPSEARATGAPATGAPETEPAEEEPPASDEPVTIKLAALSSYKTGFDELIAEFQDANPNVTIEATYYEAGDAYTTTIPTQFAGGNGSDLVFVLGGSARSYAVAPFARQGYLDDLSNESWVNSMYPATKPLYEFEGRVLARDLGMAPLAVISYSKDYFEANGLEVPTTFPALLELCGTISSQGVTPIAWGAGNPAVNANNLATLAGSTVLADDPDWILKRQSGDVAFAGPDGWRAPVQQLADMIAADCFSPGAAGAAIADMITEFATGRAAMMFTSGILNGQVLDQSPDLNIGLFPPPGQVEADTRVTLQGGGGLAIWTGSRHGDVARRFLEFISQSDPALTFASASQLIAPGQAAAGQLPGLYGDLKSFFDNGQVLPDVTATWPNTEMNSLLGDTVQGLFTGQKSVDDVLQDMDAFYERP